MTPLDAQVRLVLEDGGKAAGWNTAPPPLPADGAPSSPPSPPPSAGLPGGLSVCLGIAPRHASAAWAPENPRARRRERRLKGSSAPVPWGPTSCPCGSTGKGYARDQLIELEIAKPQLAGARGAIAKPDLRFSDLEAPPTAEHTWRPPEDAAPLPPPLPPA